MVKRITKRNVKRNRKTKRAFASKTKYASKTKCQRGGVWLLNKFRGRTGSYTVKNETDHEASAEAKANKLTKVPGIVNSMQRVAGLVPYYSLDAEAQANASDNLFPDVKYNPLYNPETGHGNGNGSENSDSGSTGHDTSSSTY